MTQILNNNLRRLMAYSRPHLGLLAVLTIYLAVTLTYGLLNPLGEAPDEIAHLGLIRFISQEGHLPRDYAERRAAGYKSAWPMLYHIATGVATGWIDYDTPPYLKANDASPRRLLVEDGLSPFVLIHTDDETFPYQGIVLAWRLVRLASTLLGAGTLIVTYLIVLAVRPGDRWLALGVAAVTAAVPQFHFIASAANDDNLLGLLSALFTLTLLRVWQQPKRRRAYAWLGLWLGLALTTKYSVGLLLVMVVVVLVRAVRQGELGWRAASGRLLLFGAALIAAVAWWFVYVEWYFNEVGDLGLAVGLIKPLLSTTGGSDASTQRVASFLTGGAVSSPLSLHHGATVWDWAKTLFQSFWLVPGQAGPTALTALSFTFLGLCCLAVAGLWRAWRRRDDLPRSVVGLLALQVGLLLPFPLFRFYLTRNPAEAGQGRHILFPAAAAIGLLLTVGVSDLFPSARRRLIALMLAGALLAVSLVTFFGFTLPAFPPRLPVRTTPDAITDGPNPVRVPLNDAVELVGHEVGQVNRYGALPVTLVWHSLAYADQDYLVELSLLDRDGQIRSLWLGQPVDGHYPTRAWDPGDVVRDAVWLPLIGVEAGDYRLELRLRSTDGAVLSPAGKEGLFLADVTLPSLLAPSLTPYSLILWQAGQPATTMPGYRYRAAIPITLHSQISNLPSLPSGAGKSQISNSVFLVGPDGVEQTPLAQAGGVYVFLVGARWPGGEYRLRVGEGEKRTESQPILRVKIRPRTFDVPPMATEVRASFGDEMMLLGFDFPERRAKPGGALPITLYWQALRPMARHYIVSNHLLNSADLRQWGGRDRVPKDYYSTALWTPGEVVRDDYLVPVFPDAPPGVYRLDIGVYVEKAGLAWPAPLVADGKALNTSSVSVAPIKVGGPPPGVTVENLLPQVPRVDRLGGLVTLLGYDLQLEPAVLNLTLYWRCDARLPADYTTFVHVRPTTGQTGGSPGAIVAQMDRPPADGAYPTSLWDPGEIIRDPVRIPIPPQAPPGDYEIAVGLYEFATGVRLPAVDAAGGNRWPDDAISLRTIAIERQ